MPTKSALGNFINFSRLCLGIAWKLTAFMLTLAIVLGLTAGPTARSDRSSSQEPQPVWIERTENLVRIYTKIPTEKNMLKVDLIDPLGRNHLYLAYDSNGLNHWFTPYAEGLHLGYAKRPGGAESLNIRTPRVNYSVGLEDNGESGVIIVVPSENQRRIGEISVSPEGKLRPSSGNTEVQP